MEFQSFNKVPRLFRDVIVTEKIDGTNGQILIAKPTTADEWGKLVAHGTVRVGDYAVFVGSRNRWIKPGDDNFGFAAWVYDNAEDLVDMLGEGRHYGEWFGGKIQRGYGITDKRFALFNTGVFGEWAVSPRDFQGITGLTVVPVLHQGPFDLKGIVTIGGQLKATGSRAVPGFMNPEGVMVWHAAARQIFKYTLDGDGHKG